MDTVIVIVGPTASGKSSKAIELAKKLDGEVINADAFQVYKELNIGTAKVTKEEMQGIKHHLFSYVEPTQDYDVVRWRKDAIEVIEDILKRNKRPIICGGSNLYVNSLVYNYNFQADLKRDDYEDTSSEELYEELKKGDPEQAKTIHINNRKRLTRAINILRAGMIKTEIDNQNEKPLYKFEIVNVSNNFTREEIYKRINQRVEKMFDDGLEDEIKQLNSKYDFNNLQAFQAIGYKEFIIQDNNPIDINQVKEDIKTATRRYAKKQLTWIKKHFNNK